MGDPVIKLQSTVAWARRRSALVVQIIASESLVYNRSEGDVLRQVIINHVSRVNFKIGTTTFYRRFFS
jgi:hypothetical protein